MSSSVSIPGLNKTGATIVSPKEKTTSTYKEESGFMGANFNSLDNKIYRGFSKSAPPWRIISKGPNLEAKCQTTSCKAHGRMVWVKKGIGEFDIIDIIFEESTKCPQCDKPTEDPKNLGFYDCTYAIKGKMMKPERKAVDAEDSAPSGRLTTFTPSKALWLKLVITTSKV